MSTPAGRPELEVSVTDLQRHYADLVDAAVDGHTVVLTRHGRPVARLVPYGLPVDDLESFEAIADDVEEAFGRLRAYTRRHTATPAQEHQ